MRVGLTGGIGSGKSTVATMFRSHGAEVVDADAIARDVVGHPDIVAQLKEVFGQRVVDEEGRVNRRELATAAFATEEGTRQLNEVTHPAILRRAARLLAEAEARSPSGIVVYDMPLLIESGGEASVDVIVVVDTQEEIAVRRAVSRGFEEADVRNRMARQASRQERRDRADFVIDNSGDLASTRTQVMDVWQQVSARD